MKMIEQYTKTKKTEFLGVRLTADTKAALELLCESAGLTLSAAVEQIIRNYINYSKEIQERLSRN